MDEKDEQENKNEFEIGNILVEKPFVEPKTETIEEEEETEEHAEQEELKHEVFDDSPSSSSGTNEIDEINAVLDQVNCYRTEGQHLTLSAARVIAGKYLETRIEHLKKGAELKKQPEHALLIYQILNGFGAESLPKTIILQLSMLHWEYENAIFPSFEAIFLKYAGNKLFFDYSEETDAAENQKDIIDRTIASRKRKLPEETASTPHNPKHSDAKCLAEIVDNNPKSTEQKNEHLHAPFENPKKPAISKFYTEEQQKYVDMLTNFRSNSNLRITTARMLADQFLTIRLSDLNERAGESNKIDSLIHRYKSLKTFGVNRFDDNTVLDTCLLREKQNEDEMFNKLERLFFDNTTAYWGRDKSIIDHDYL